MSYGTNKCAACGNRTTVPGHRYNGSVRYLCQRDVCRSMRATGSVCGTCGVKVWTSISSCDICNPGGRKVSTEGKTARGSTPDSGSIPGCSTDDNELLVAYEDMADRLEKVEAELLELRKIVIELKQYPLYTTQYPEWTTSPTSGSWSYDKNGGITYKPYVR